MEKKNNIGILNVVALLLFAAVSLLSCASPATPQGGPRDKEPPKIVYELPNNYTTNFSSKKVTIEFDEYIQLKDQQKNIIISPPIRPRPTFTLKGRSIVIDIKAKLDSATTYTINFGNAIVDNNEGNPMYDYSYVFSTGKTIDSLVMSGQLIDVVKGDTIIGGLVMFFNAQSDTTWKGQPEVDSTLFLSKVMSVARTDSNGVFLATNLKGIDYRVYAIADKNGNNAYEAGDEMIGILDSTLNPLRMPPFKVWYNPIKKRINATPQVTMKLFKEIPVRRQNLSTMKRPSAREFVFEFASSAAVVDSLLLEGVTMDSLITMKSTNGDTLYYWLNKEIIPDTLKGRVVYQTTDSVGGPTTASKRVNLTYQKGPKKRKDDGPQKNPFSVIPNVTKTISPEKEISFTFKYPLVSFDSSRITLQEEIAIEQPQKMTRQQRQEAEKAEKKAVQYRDKSFHFERDSINLMVWYLRTNLKEGLMYNLTIPDSVFVNVMREHNDTLRASFTTLSTENSAMMKLKLKGDTSKLYILELTDKAGKVAFRKRFVKPGAVDVKYIPAGEYKIRLTEDSNKNGKWDTGSLTAVRLAERIAFVKDKKSGVTLFTARENWEMELDIDLEELFPSTLPPKIEEAQIDIKNKEHED